MEGIHKPTASWKGETESVRIKYVTETEIMVFFIEANRWCF